MVCLRLLPWSFYIYFLCDLVLLRLLSLFLGPFTFVSLFLGPFTFTSFIPWSVYVPNEEDMMDSINMIIHLVKDTTERCFYKLFLMSGLVGSRDMLCHIPQGLPCLHRH